MKSMLVILLVLLCGAAVAQTGATIPGIPIPNLPTQLGKPLNAWVPISKNGITYKIDINDIAANKLDTAFVRGDSLYVVKNGVVKGATLPTNSGSVPPAANNAFEDAFTGAANSYNLAHMPIAGTVKLYVNGVKIPPEAYTVSGNTVLVNTAFLSFTLSVNDRIDITYNSTFQISS